MSEALDHFISIVSSNPNIGDKDKASLITMARDIALQSYQSGVQKGYMKVIQDHRAGFINIPSSPHAKLDEAIALAVQERLSPTQHFKDGK